MVVGLGEASLAFGKIAGEPYAWALQGIMTLVES